MDNRYRYQFNRRRKVNDWKHFISRKVLRRQPLNMRIIAKKEFLDLPPGVIFSSYSPCFFGGLFVKGDSIKEIGDFFESGLIGNPENNSSEDFVNSCELMKSGNNIPIDVNFYGREGFFDEKKLYAIYSKEDTEKIISVL